MGNVLGSGDVAHGGAGRQRPYDTASGRPQASAPPEPRCTSRHAVAPAPAAGAVNPSSSIARPIR